MLPYSAEVLYALYGQYNQAIWPIQILFLVLAGTVLVLILRPWRLFGIAPGPTALFTLGVMLLAHCRARLMLAVIPVLWIAIETWSAWVLGMPQDLALVVVAGIALLVLLRPPRWAGRQAED